MSIFLAFAPLAIALTVTLKETIGDQLSQNNGSCAALPSMETIFNDTKLLQKTLQEHGLSVTAVSENHLTCTAEEVQLDYVRQSAETPFFVTISGVKNIDKFLSEIDCFEREYKQNVQSFTYHKLVEGLGENNMTIEQETLLEDNSIMLTINVE